MKKTNIERLEQAINQSEMSDKSKDSIAPIVDLNVPKLKGKTYEEITATSVVTIPKNTFKPVNQRIYCVEQLANEMKTSGGLIIPSKFSMPESQRRNVEREMKRYFVVDVADDVDISFNGNKIMRGDEVCTFMPSDAIAYSPTTICDFGSGTTFIVFHQSEIAGCVRHEIEKEF
jgi:co-chaperonin GroES (HSP10)